MTLEGHSDWVRSIAFSPNGQLLASSSDDKTIKLWDPITGELQQTLEGHSDRVHLVAFSPNGQQLASGYDDKTIKLWDPITGKLRQTLKGHTNWVWPETNVVISIQENQWICYQGEKMLWLPSEYRPICLTVRDGILALGHSSGRVSFVSRFI
jgi:WD40 repeat protein